MFQVPQHSISWFSSPTVNSHVSPWNRLIEMLISKSTGNLITNFDFDTSLCSMASYKTPMSSVIWQRIRENALPNNCASCSVLDPFSDHPLSSSASKVSVCSTQPDLYTLNSFASKVLVSFLSIPIFQKTLIWCDPILNKRKML